MMKSSRPDRHPMTMARATKSRGKTGGPTKMSEAETTETLNDASAADDEQPSAGGRVYEQMMAAVMAAEYDRRKAVEGRGAAILTTSTTMLTLIFGLTVLVIGKDQPFKNHLALWFVTSALAAFVLSAVIA